MKFGQPLLTTELSGSMGGAVASSARGGVGYFRRRSIPGNPRTPGQTIVRSILASISAAWVSVLTGPQRAAWEAIAGEESSGIGAFNKSNSQVLIAGNSRIDTAPVSLAFANPPVVDTPVVDESANTVSITFDAANLGQTNVYISSPQSVSRASRQFNYLYANTSGVDATGATALAIPATHPAFNVQVGQVVYVRLVAFDNTTGAVGIAQEFRVTATA